MGQKYEKYKQLFFPFCKKNIWDVFKDNLVLIFFLFFIFLFLKKGPRKNKIKMACVSQKCIICMEKRLLLHIWNMKSLLLCNVTRCSCGLGQIEKVKSVKNFAVGWFWGEPADPSSHRSHTVLNQRVKEVSPPPQERSSVLTEWQTVVATR